jgi:hypothetical protein
MSAQENKAIVRRLYEEAISQKKPEVFDEIMSPEIIGHAPFPEQAPGLEGFKGCSLCCSQPSPTTRAALRTR